jgi:hypothetical protein
MTFTDILGLPKLWVSTCTVLQIQEILTLAVFQHSHVTASDKCINYLNLFQTGKQNAFPKPVTAHFNRETLYNTVQTNQPTRCNSFTSLILDVYVWLYMFRVPPHPSSGAYNCTRSLWFYRWRMAVEALLVVAWQVTC